MMNDETHGDSPQLELVCASDIPIRRRWDEKQWNGWRLESSLELVYPAYPGGGVYPVDIERLTSSSQMLDIIMQVAGKSWATDECLAGLVRALDHIFQPQANLCSGGSDKRLTAAQIRRLVP
jgi:hypothetical protein